MAKNVELKWARNFFAANKPIYDRAHAYYNGKHKQLISDDVRAVLDDLFRGIRKNLCPVVVDSLADRLILTGLTVAGNETWGRSTFSAQKLEYLSQQLHKDAVKLGDAFAIVWPDPVTKRARIYPQDRGLIAVRYDDDGTDLRIVEGLKAWRQYQADGTYKLRVTRYLPDKIQRFIAASGSRSTVPDSIDALTLYNTDGAGEEEPNPYGVVPIFHFPNSMRADEFACTELADAIPLQDGLNYSLTQMLVGEEFQGLPQRWVTGLQTFTDPDTGEVVKPFTTGADRIWSLAKENAKFGQFDAADLEQFIKVLDFFALSIAQVTRTPAHNFMLHTGDFPSGEALKTADAPMANKVRGRQEAWGAIWEKMAAFCAQVEGQTFTDITANWQDTTPHSEKDQAETALSKKEVGVSKTQLLRELGYSDELIEKMATENEEDAARAAEQMARTFNAGPPTRTGKDDGQDDDSGQE